MFCSLSCWSDDHDRGGQPVYRSVGEHEDPEGEPEGTIATIAGNGTRGYSGDGGPALEASLNGPYALKFDASGNLYFSDASNSVIRKIDTAGIISTVAGHGVATGSIDGEGGDPADDLGDHGPTTAATLNLPRGVLVDGAGNLYIADTNNHRVRKVDASGAITTVAGSGLGGFSGDGSTATAARVGTRAVWLLMLTGTCWSAAAAAFEKWT